jgi:phage terminase large subunit-like protein
MKEFAAAVVDGRLHHDGCPVLAWAISNVVCHVDAKDNIYPRKAMPANKIDPVVALLMAFNRVMLEPPVEDSGWLLDLEAVS